MNYYIDKMNELGADGIDFVYLGFITREQRAIIKSYTKEELLNNPLTPRADYRFWKMKDGKKKYILPEVGELSDEEQEIYKQTMKRLGKTWF